MSKSCASTPCEKKNNPWLVPLLAGAAVGGLNLAHYLLSAYVPDTVRFGIFPGGSVLLAPMWFTGKLSPQFKAIIIFGLGVVAGSFAVSVATGKLSLRSFRESKLPKSALWKALLGGLLMGFGLLMSEGCLVRHTLTGLPTLQLSSIVSVAGMAIGMWGGIKLMAGGK